MKDVAELGDADDPSVKWKSVLSQAGANPRLTYHPAA